MKKTLLLLFALLGLGVSGAWADVIVTLADASVDPYTYGTRSNSNKTFTSNDASGFTGVVLDVTGSVDHYSSGTYVGRLALKTSAASTDETWTLTAPDGYLIKGYSFSARAAGSYTATITAGGTVYNVTNDATYTDVEVTGLKAKTTSFTVNASAANWIAVGPFTVTLTPITFMSLTFDRSGTTVSDVTVNVKDADGDAIPDVTASLEAINFDAFKTGSASVLSNTTNSVLAPASYTNQQNSTIEYTFKVEGLPATFTYNRVSLDVYQMNGGGTTQDPGTVREWTLAVETGNAADNLEAFVSQENVDICSATEVNGGLKHKLWGMTGSADKDATDALYIKVILTRTDQYGCYAGISEVQLFNVSATVQYVISDAYGVVYTSDASEAKIGDVITTLPDEYKRDNCSYNVTETTIEQGDNVVQVSMSYELFTVSKETDLENATWYFINLNNEAEKYLFSNGTSSKFTKGEKNSSNPSCQWAFFGNPYDNFYIMNRNDGAGKYLQCMTPSKMNTSLNATWGRWTITKSGEGFIMRLPVQNYWFADNDNSWVQNAEGAATIYVEEVPAVTFVNVTYELYESNGTTLVTSVEKEQVANSDIDVPSSLNAPTYYDYSTEGTIGDSDCTIKVTRTLKSGYVISLDGLSNSKCYNIRNNRGTWAVGSGATDVNSTVELDLAFSASDTKQQFAFITYEGNVYLYSVGEGKFAYVDGTKLSLTAEVTSAVVASAVTFQASTNTTYQNSEPTIVTVGGDMFGVSTGKSPDVFKYNVQNDGGNCAYIIEAGDFDATNALEALDYYFNPSATLKYVIRDSDGGLVYETAFEPATVDETITALPNELQRPFCTYSEINKTIERGENTINVTVTYNLPFEVGTEKLYYAKLRGHYVYYDETNTDVRTNQSSLEATPAYMWSFSGNPYSGIKVKSAATGTYFNNASSKVELSEEGYAWTITRLNDTATFGLYNGENYINEQNTGNHNLIYWWNFETDAGSQWQVEEVPYVTYIVKDASDNVLFTSDPVTTTNGAQITTIPDEYKRSAFYSYNEVNVTISNSGNTDVEFTATPKADAPVKFTADASAPEYYNLSIRSKYLVYNSEATGQVTLQDESEPFNANASWAFIGNPYSFKLINKTKGTTDFLTYTSVITGRHGTNNIQFVANDDFTDEYWTIDTNTSGIVFRMKNNTSIYFHHDNGNNYLRTCSMNEWSAVHNDQGSTIIASTDEDVLLALNDVMQGISIGTGIGQFNSTNPELTNEVAISTISSVNAVVTQEMTSAYADAYAALLNVSNNIALVTPTAGFYRLKNVATDKYLIATAIGTGYNDANKYVYANGDANSAATVIRLGNRIGHEDDGQLYMYNQGDGFGWVDASQSTGSGVVYVTADPDKYVNWFPGNAAGQIAFSICLGNGTGNYASYLEKGIYTTDTEEAVVGGTDYTADAAQWTFEEATDFDITLNGPVEGKYYATLCVPFDVTLDGATAYTLEKNGTDLAMTEVTGAVAAGTPVLLEGTSASATATIGSNYSTAISSETALTGTYFAISDFEGDTNYVLGTDGTKVGFFHWEGSTLKANRAYIAGEAAVGVGGEVKGFYLNHDIATQIREMVGASDGKATYYDLSGRRVTQPARGLYIMNGKKVAVK